MKGELDSKHTSVESSSQSIEVAYFTSHHIQTFSPRHIGVFSVFHGKSASQKQSVDFYNVSSGASK